MKYWIILMVALSTSVAASVCSPDGNGGYNCVEDPNPAQPGDYVERPGNMNPDLSLLPVKSTLETQISRSGASVSPAETAALLAQHNKNAKANADRWETLVCSMRPVKGKTIEGILFRNEIPYWFNCND